MKVKTSLKTLLAIGILSVAVFAITAFADTAQNSPTSCTTGWTNCGNAFADGGSAATATRAGKVSNWSNYGFSIPSGSTINSVTVRADFWATKTNGYIDVQVTNNGGTTWGTAHRVGGNTAEQTFNIDVTSDFSWTPSGLSNANFKVRTTTVKLGGGRNPTWNLDWIPVTVMYTPPGDSQAPVVSSVTPTSANEDVSTNYQVTATDNVGVTNCDFYWNGGLVGAMSLVSGNAQNGVWQKAYTENTPGTHTAQGQCSDAASNTAWGALTNITINDVTPPGPITNLYETATGTSWINWVWTNPSDSDLNHIEVWLNNTFKANTTNAYYNVTGLQANTGYQIQVRPVDNSGNIGQWTNDTAFTQAAPDTQPPTVSSIWPTSAPRNTNTTFFANASDNVQVSYCNFQFGSSLRTMFLYSGTYQNGTWATYFITPNTTGVYQANATCWDTSSNMGSGPVTNITIF